jgi:geranylgeranyl pyrophosphate synthase
VHKSNAIEKTKSLLDFYVNNAITQLKDFADSEAKTALSNMILALKLE